MASDFLIQVVHKSNGKVVDWEPGGRAELDLISSLSDRLMDKSIGVATTRAQVVAVVEQTLKDVLLELKHKV